MKFMCFGYIDPHKLEAMPASDRNAAIDRCLDYDDRLREKGHFGGAEALHPPASAKTVRWRNGQAVVTDGPFAETKEQIGGILLLEASDLDEAVRLMQQHPGIENGPFEIRAVADMSTMKSESAERRLARKAQRVS
jgi:hypothetical protein